MKTILISLTLVTILLYGCNNSASHDHGSGAHTHADGSTHADHAKTDTTKQEEFTAVGDTASAKPHTHADGKEHTHGDGHKHE
jgi:uncharacterized lipoprotein NlpE involved in copper resistance